MRPPLLWAGVLATVFCACAQDIDTVPTRRFTILDQVADPVERQAFRDLYKEHEAARRRELAIRFPNRFPDSWLLGQAYEIVAKAAMDLNDTRTALDYGDRALRLWPENPLLLVPLANLRVKEGMLDAASRNATDALWSLDRFEWPQVERSLKASSYFVLGRAAAVKAFGTTGETKARYLADAEQSLIKAAGFDPTDAEIPYLHGLVELGLNRPAVAAWYFTETSRMHGALEAQARKQLDALSSVKPEKPPVAPETATKPSPVLPAYAGSETCKTCHPREYASWKQTGMSRMFRAYKPENVRGDFSGSQVIESARPVLDHGRPSFDIRGSDNHWARYPVEFTIGSKWQQAYATKFPDGRIQVFPVQYNALEHRWVNYWKLTDAPGSERAQIEKFASELPTATYQLNCAPCHTSQLTFTKGEESASFREAGVNCEMCHGPSAAHTKVTPVRFGKISATEFVAICSQCHMQSGLRTSEIGGNFYHVSLSRPYVDFSRKAFYKDGRFRVTTFIVESFVRSRCFRDGQAHCGYCHDPHPPDPTSNPTSLKYPKTSDAMCLQCHTTFRANQQAHTRHALSSEGSRCVSCHMPPIMESLLFNARSHQIDDIPSAEMTERFGQRDSPNACFLCHREKNSQWLKHQLELYR